MKICVVGSGYVGLVTGACLAGADHGGCLCGLPRLAGVDFALKHVVSGNPAAAADALEAGAIDRIADGDIVEAAVTYAEELVADDAPLKRASELTIDAGQFNDARATRVDVDKTDRPRVGVGGGERPRSRLERNSCRRRRPRDVG